MCVCVCMYICVLAFPSGCLTDGAALSETAASRCGCSLTGGPGADALDLLPSLSAADWGDMWLCCCHDVLAYAEVIHLLTAVSVVCMWMCW